MIATLIPSTRNDSTGVGRGILLAMDRIPAAMPFVTIIRRYPDPDDQAMLDGTHAAGWHGFKTLLTEITPTAITPVSIEFFARARQTESINNLSLGIQKITEAWFPLVAYLSTSPSYLNKGFTLLRTGTMYSVPTIGWPWIDITIAELNDMASGILFNGTPSPTHDVQVSNFFAEFTFDCLAARASNYDAGDEVTTGEIFLVDIETSRPVLYATDATVDYENTLGSGILVAWPHSQNKIMIEVPEALNTTAMKWTFKPKWTIESGQLFYDKPFHLDTKEIFS